MKIPHNQQFGRACTWSTITLHFRLRMSWSDKENNVVVGFNITYYCSRSSQRAFAVYAFHIFCVCLINLSTFDFQQIYSHQTGNLTK